MRHSIYAKFILSYILFGLMCILFMNMWSTKRVKEQITYDAAATLYNTGTLILNNYIPADLTALDEENTSALDEAAMLNNNIVWIIDTKGTILYNSDKKNSLSQVSNFDITSFRNSYYITGDFFGHFSEKKVSVVVPVVSDFETQGYILLHKDMVAINQSSKHQVHVIYMTFIAMFGFSLIILLIFNFVVFMPLNKISAAAREYAKGNFKYDGLKKFTDEDEIGRLGVSLNYMASRLDDMEEDEKKFISNISHDFRSPLTSMKGYIEAMKDGTIPYEAQGKYLDIVLFETERLTKLTQNLLSLNSWDNKTMRLNLSTFNLYDFIKPILATFEGKCEKKNINIDLTLGSKDYYVNADQSKIQQVVYNLLDNAVKFSHNDSTIYVKIIDKNDKIFISVKDEGIGIPKESLNKIWDRFYKTDLSRGKDKTGTGLGLSIVKEMVQAHGENINVISTEGVGTKFVFTLKRVKK